MTRFEAAATHALHDASRASKPPTSDPGFTGETITLKVFRGTPDDERREVSYQVPGVIGMVVLDAIHYIQHNLDTDLAARWNCKAAKRGSCGAEINGKPLLLCKTRIDALPAGPITVRPMQAFPLIKDLVTDAHTTMRSTNRFRPSPQPSTMVRRGESSRPTSDGSVRVPALHRVLSLPGRLPCHSHPRPIRSLLRPAVLRAYRRTGDAPRRHPQPHRADLQRGWSWLLQHHQMLHGGLSRAHQDQGRTRSSRSKSAVPTGTGTRYAGWAARCSANAATTTNRQRPAGQHDRYTEYARRRRPRRPLAQAGSTCPRLRSAGATRGRRT